MVKYLKHSFGDLMNIAEKNCSYKFDGDPTGRGDDSDGVLLAISFLGEQDWELVGFIDYYFYFKKSIIVVKL